MNDDVELEGLLRDLYRAPQDVQATGLGLPEGQAPDPQQLRSGVSQDQLRRLQDAISAAKTPVELASARSPRRRSRRVGWAVAAAVVVGGVWLMVPNATREGVPGGWTFEAEQQLRPFRSNPTSLPPPATSALPTYGPNSQIRLVFRRPNTGDDIGVGNALVYRMIEGRSISLPAHITLRTTSKAHTVIVEGQGRAWFGEQPGAMTIGFLFMPVSAATSSVAPEDIASVRALSDTRWLERPFLYRTPSGAAPTTK